MATFFLVFLAWVGTKAMQYHGDYDRMIRDAQRYLRENNAVEFDRDKSIPFFQRKVIPAIEKISTQRKGGLSSTVPAGKPWYRCADLPSPLHHVNDLLWLIEVRRLTSVKMCRVVRTLYDYLDVEQFCELLGKMGK